ncbi:MAG: hypothetical protein DLM58_23965 [Pseudonocardiales bacterium]|nr:MAG: hypothetical protein DLM58_23965 [Pseudonocardiales bacterium]
MTLDSPIITDRSSVDDDMREAPPAVIGAAAAGVAPTPFLGVYAVLFIAHGFFHPVQPPDITTTRNGEAAAGVIAALLLLVLVLAIFWFLNGRRRWPFVIGQLATLVTSIDFVLDPTTGSPAVPVVLALTSGTALVLAFLPASWAWFGVRPGLPRRGAKSAPSQTSDADA